MPGLNLLPWREHQHQAATRRLLGLLFGVALIAVLITWVIDQWGRQAQYRQTLEVASVRQAIEGIDDQLALMAQRALEQQQVQQQVQALASLQGGRWHLVELLEQLEGAVPQGVYLTAVSREGLQLRIQGLAQSGTLVAQLLRNLACGLGEATMQQLKAVDEGEAFELSVALRGNLERME
ncbi:Fimbrial assembly protein (PilN) [compost metagenome]